MAVQPRAVNPVYLGKETNDVIAKKRSDDGALLDEEVLESGADRIAVRLLLLLVPAREPAGDLATARLVR